MKKYFFWIGLSCLFALICSTGWFVVAQEAKPADADRALERTRKQVRMLDDIYKGSIVLITKNYVNSDKDLAAGTAFKQIFAIAKEKGWHEVRLVDATGDPYEDANAPQDDFEKKAIEELKAGKATIEEVINDGDDRILRAATPIPVVMDKCVMCHSHYADVAKGAPIGALIYRITIDE
jgi:Protein of unknown function (DUF3365)